MIRLICLLALAVSPEFTAAFLPTKHLVKKNVRPSFYATDDKSWQPERKKGLLFMSNQFDVTRPVFDILSFRSVRGDALIRYDALNQSEPIRILLYGIYSLVLLSAPSLSEAVGYGELGLLGRVGSAVGAVSFAGLFVRECSRRNNQLRRIEKELNTEMLPIRLPANALSDKSFSRAVTLKELRSAPTSSMVPPRILAVCGTKPELQQALKGLTVLGRRLRQASVYVVPVSTDCSKASDWGLPSPSGTSKLSWLADASDPDVWLEFFDGLSSTTVSEKNDEAKSTPSFRWFGLTSGGQSFGSGEGESPVWLQILGQHLRPTELLDPSDKSIAADQVDTAKLLSAQTEFYQALTKGDILGINAIFSDVSAPQVTEVLKAGGRIDTWNDCLADGARPENMSISGSDVIAFSTTEAYTTNVEFPVISGFDSATLLAVQQWGRASDMGDWKLQLHQTIPWSPDTRAGGTLRCDCRGCVALTRGPEKRTFGGMIG